MSRKYLGDFVNSCIKEDIEVFTNRLLIEYDRRRKVHKDS